MHDKVQKLYLSVHNIEDGYKNMCLYYNIIGNIPFIVL